MLTVDRTQDTLYWSLDENEINRHVCNITLLNCAKIWENLCKNFTEWDIRMQ